MPDASVDDLTLDPADGRPPKRLLVLLHGAGSSPGHVVQAGVAWQIKFSSAQVWIPAGEIERDGRRHWVDPEPHPITHERFRQAAATLQRRIAERQRSTGLPAQSTIIAGFSQGASLALELAFDDLHCAVIIVAFAARLFRETTPQDSVRSVVHFVHGGVDTVVDRAHGERAFRRLSAVGALATIDILDEEAHPLTQTQINVATQRVMQTLFRTRIH